MPGNRTVFLGTGCFKKGQTGAPRGRSGADLRYLQCVLGSSAVSERRKSPEGGMSSPQQPWLPAQSSTISFLACLTFILPFLPLRPPFHILGHMPTLSDLSRVSHFSHFPLLMPKIQGTQNNYIYKSLNLCIYICKLYVIYI